MGKITGFLEIDRHDRKYAPVADRLKHYREFVIPLSEKDTRDQAARCMNCGIPYCHGTGSVAPGTPGCPVNNQIPDFNDLVYQGNWEEASRNLHSTNNFPEFTGRICPAPCEASCTLNIDDNPVTIKTIECAIVDRAWDNGWLKPEIAPVRTGKKVAIIGSGPAGLAAAQQLARAGHDVHVYEKFAKAGGLLRYGIPDFKMEKHVIDRRVAQMEAEGVTFHYGVHVGGTSQGAIDPRELLNQYDAVALTGGAEAGRDLPIPGRDLDGIHFAMDFLPQQNRRVSSEPLGDATDILAEGKHVVVIGGGDTGSDCIGTSFRQGAKSVTQLEIMPAPPEHENKGITWPNWPLEDADLVEPGRRRQARIRGADAEILGRRRQGAEAALRPGRRQVQADRRHRIRTRRAARAARHGLRASGARGHAEEPRRRSRPARQRPRQHRRTTRPRCPTCSPPATCAAASRWWCGRSARAGCARGRSTSI